MTDEALGNCGSVLHLQLIYSDSIIRMSFNQSPALKQIIC